MHKPFCFLRTNFQNERSSDFQSMVHHSSHGGEICANHAALMAHGARANLISFKCKSASSGYISCKEGVVRCRQERAIVVSKAKAAVAVGGFMQTSFFCSMRDVTSALYVETGSSVG